MTPRHEMPPVGAAAALAARIAASVPVMNTARLRLRAPEAADFAAYFAIVGGTGGIHVGGPMPRDEAWADFIQLASGWMLHGHGGWAIEDRETGQTLGFVILGLEPGDQEPELGFLLSEAAEGRGVAFEAATAARDFAREALNLPSLVSYVATGNTRSTALARRLGAKIDPEAGRAIGEADLDVFRHWGGRT